MRRRTGTSTGETTSARRWPVMKNQRENAMTGTCDNHKNDNDSDENSKHKSLMTNAMFVSESLLRTCSAPMALLHQSLSGLGVTIGAENDFTTAFVVVPILLCFMVMLLVTWYCCCYRGTHHHHHHHHHRDQRPNNHKHRQKSRKELNHELELARAKVRLLEDKLEELNNTIRLADTNNGDKEIRIFMDGAFDLLHYGHMNAFRLARSLGTHLIVGVNSDESITRCKGAPLMTDTERLTMVKTCKFVDEVVEDCPYVMSPEYLEWVIQEYRIDYVVHGSDPCFTLDGQDVYASAKARGKFREIPRTEGVSTSDILGRILVMTREHHIYYDRKQIKSDADEQGGRQEEESTGNFAVAEGLPYQLKSKFLTTSLLLKLFSAGVKAPQKDAKVIYIDGTWDLFHPGHVAILKAAREVSTCSSPCTTLYSSFVHHILTP